jgi:hypothetical protein
MLVTSSVTDDSSSTDWCDGWDEGAKEGLAEGAELGNWDGNWDGILDRTMEGLMLGLAEGAELGPLDGNWDGILDGTMEGLMLGCWDIDGSKLGYCDGMVDGSCDGSWEGRALGVPVGPMEGLEEGLKVGLFDGRKEGSMDLVGLADGTLVVGCWVGKALGWNDGTLVVGCWVGKALGWNDGIEAIVDGGLEGNAVGPPNTKTMLDNGDELGCIEGMTEGGMEMVGTGTVGPLNSMEISATPFVRDKNLTRSVSSLLPLKLLNSSPSPGSNFETSRDRFSSFPVNFVVINTWSLPSIVFLFIPLAAL